MSKTVFEENLEARAELFKALGHPMRLLILNLVKIKPRHGEELATILGLKPATISHHLSKLTQVGFTHIAERPVLSSVFAHRRRI